MTLKVNQVYFSPPAPWPSGKARVCKTLISGPNPLGASTKTAAQIEWAAVLLFAECFGTLNTMSQIAILSAANDLLGVKARFSHALAGGARVVAKSAPQNDRLRFTQSGTVSQSGIRSSLPTSIPPLKRRDSVRSLRVFG